MSLDTGSLVSHYRIVRRLGAGGMGEVFLAQDLQLDRQVAIKFVKAPDERSHKRLVQEARAAASLDHPYICAVYEVGSDSVEGDFIVMQFVDGEPLSTRLQRQRLPPAEAIAMCRRIAEALKIAHQQGIIHRDLKPHNVIVTPGGEPKLLDFGIAKRVLSDHAAAEADTTSQATHPDAQVGTPAYMSPEQVRSHPADYRSDLFALGCVLYECLTGRRAFSGPTTADILGQVLHVEPPPPSAVVPELGTLYDPICARLLKKDPKDRFQSAEEVLGALYALTPTASVQAHTGSSTGTGRTSAIVVPLPTTRWGRIAAVAVIVVVLAGSIALWQWSRGAHLPEPTPDAKSWFDKGLDALRDGSYVKARSAFDRAIALFPNYVLAYSRLAEARSELDDEDGAKNALLTVSQFVSDQRLGSVEQLRLSAVRGYVIRHFDESVDAYRKLAAKFPRDARSWLDVGRAEQARAHTRAARDAYEKARELEPEYAAAHLRYGMTPGVSVKEALSALEKAESLYHIDANVEGETEALIQQGVVQSGARKLAAARDALDRAIAKSAADPSYVSQRVRAQFELAVVISFQGKLADAEDLGSKAVKAALDAGLDSFAARGSFNLGSALLNAGRFHDAEEQFNKARDIAASKNIAKLKWQAQLSVASIRESTAQPAEALKLAQDALKFFSSSEFLRNEASAKRVISRSYAAMENYDEARRVIDEVIDAAARNGEDDLLAGALDDRVSQLTSTGFLPAALADMERVEPIHRQVENRVALAYDLTNHAELLITLGRPNEAEEQFAQVAAGVAQGIDAFKTRPPRVALLRALTAAIAGHFPAVPKLADEAGAGASGDLTETQLTAIVLKEYARSQTNQSRTPAATIAQWPHRTTARSLQRDLSYWVALILLARHEPALAKSVATEAVSAPVAQNNIELRWRLNAILAIAEQSLGQPSASASLSRRVGDDLRQLTAAWATHAAYFNRPDLVALRKRIALPATGG